MIKPIIAKAFTIVELIVVIAVIGILVSVTVFGFGAWRERSAATELKSDLNNLALAMKNELNFNNAYPLNLPSSYKSSKDVAVSYVSGDKGSFCVEATSKAVSDYAYYVNSTDQTSPIKGTCDGGPGAKPSTTPGFSMIAAGLWQTCGVLTTDNKLYCWGLNSSGTLGDGTTTWRNKPTQVVSTGVLSGKTIKQIAMGYHHMCVIASDDKAYCWGDNTRGQLGDGTTTQRTVPVAVSQGAMPAGATIKKITAGNTITCAVASDNKAYCWGWNGYGQLGNGGTTDAGTPTPVLSTGVLNGKTITDIQSRALSTCVLANDNKAYCWGINSSGQLGDGTTNDASAPVAIAQGGLPAGQQISYKALVNIMSVFFLVDRYIVGEQTIMVNLGTELPRIHTCRHSSLKELGRVGQLPK